MIHVHANPAVGAAFNRRDLGAWAAVDSAVGAVGEAGALMGGAAGDVTQGIVGGKYDWLVPLVMIGAIGFALSE